MFIKTPLETLIFPSPPLCVEDDRTLVPQGAPGSVLLWDNNRLKGKIRRFDCTGEKLVLVLETETGPVTLGIGDFKTLQLLQQRDWYPADIGGGNQESVQRPVEPKEFVIHFTDDDCFKGKSRGIRNDRHGIYLFPPIDRNSFHTTFFPHSAMRDYQVGPRIGSVLVSENVLSEEALDVALREQKESRQLPIGEYLRNNAVLTTGELERALERQKTMPSLRLGEVLVAEQLINEADLALALEEQKQDRGKPLGEILMLKGLVTRENIQQSLAKKLGIPYLDLSTFDIDETVIKKIPGNVARNYRFMPVSLIKNKLIIAMENPLDWKCIDAIKFVFKGQVDPVMASQQEIDRLLDVYYGEEMGGDFNLDELEHDEESNGVQQEVLEEKDFSDNIVVRLVNRIIADSVRNHASDVHIEPYSGKQRTRIRIRKDGLLTDLFEIPQHLRRAVVARLKVMSELDTSVRMQPQDGKINFGRYQGKKIEIRIATIPTANNEEDVVMRLLTGGEPVPLDKIGIRETDFKKLNAHIQRPHGLILVCGPTGSGKTTTLHSILRELNTPEKKIWTVEDPVEYKQYGLRQVQVNAKSGLDFQSALRAFLRADPDIIMVGEIRDRETAEIAIKASLTGHLVLATLHTNSAAESVTRLLSMGVDPFNFASALVCVLGQRLARCLCKECVKYNVLDQDTMRDLAREYISSEEVRDIAVIDVRIEGVVRGWQQRHADQSGNLVLPVRGSCGKCGTLGYMGRIGVYELLTITRDISELIASRASVSAINIQAGQEGMLSLKQDGIEKILAGHTDLDEIRRVTI